MHFKIINEEVLYTSDKITKINSEDIEFLKNKASENRRKRIRLCAHKNAEDYVHEMLIVHSKGSYVRPHNHPNKCESFHIIEGKLKVVIFDIKGSIKEVVNMGDYNSGDVFFFRLSEGCFHTVIPISNDVVFHETTKGPFIKENTEFPDWGPIETDTDKIKIFLNKCLS